VPCHSTGCGEVLLALREMIHVLEEVSEEYEPLRRVREERPDVFLLIAAVLAAASALLDNMLEARKRGV